MHLNLIVVLTACVLCLSCKDSEITNAKKPTNADAQNILDIEAELHFKKDVLAPGIPLRKAIELLKLAMDESEMNVDFLISRSFYSMRDREVYLNSKKGDSLSSLLNNLCAQIDGKWELNKLRGVTLVIRHPMDKDNTVLLSDLIIDFGSSWSKEDHDAFKQYREQK